MPELARLSRAKRHFCIHLQVRIVFLLYYYLRKHLLSLFILLDFNLSTRNLHRSSNGALARLNTHFECQSYDSNTTQCIPNEWKCDGQTVRPNALFTP